MTVAIAEQCCNVTLQEQFVLPTYCVKLC